ncbi:MAG: hypothetical protein PHF86_11085 [Candidatus Nanoarchaeia archaeon]|nr:hypothetical protein [Candidatus Nanoarchaeia archaeon]
MNQFLNDYCKRSSAEIAKRGSRFTNGVEQLFTPGEIALMDECVDDYIITSSRDVLLRGDRSHMSPYEKTFDQKSEELRQALKKEGITDKDLTAYEEFFRMQILKIRFPWVFNLYEQLVSKECKTDIEFSQKVNNIGSFIGFYKFDFPQYMESLKCQD